MRPTISNERGSAILISLALILMLSTIGIMAVKRSVTDVDLSFNKVRTDQAFQLAEAGLARSIAELKTDESWRTGYAGESLGSGKYWVAVLDSSSGLTSGDTVVLQAAGRSNGAPGSSVDLEVWLVPAYLDPFKYGVYGLDSLRFDNNSCSDAYNSDSGTYASTWDSLGGNVGTNGVMSLRNGTTIGGNAVIGSGGSIDTFNNTVILGDVITDQPPEYLDGIPESAFTWAESNNTAPAGLSGTNFTYDPVTHDLVGVEGAVITLSDGVYFFNDIDLASTSQFIVDSGADVMIFMTGDFFAGSGTQINIAGDPPDLQFFSNGDSLTVDPSTEFHGAFYGPNAHFLIHQNNSLFGSIVSKTSHLNENSCIHFDRALLALTSPIVLGFDMVAWREL